MTFTSLLLKKINNARPWVLGLFLISTFYPLFYRSSEGYLLHPFIHWFICFLTFLVVTVSLKFIQVWFEIIGVIIVYLLLVVLVAYYIVGFGYHDTFRCDDNLVHVFITGTVNGRKEFYEVKPSLVLVEHIASYEYCGYR